MTSCFVLSSALQSHSLGRSTFAPSVASFRSSPPQCSPSTATRRRPRVLSPSMSFPGPLPSTLDSSLATAQLLLSDISEVNRGPLFATAFVFFLTFWGSISFVKGSTKDRITQASFTLSETSSDIARKTARYLMERSFTPDPSQDERKGVMTFTGEVRASSSVASILVAVAASGLWAATYILNFILPPTLQSDYWGFLTLLSFAVVPWYWKKANRTEYVKVMVEQEDDSAVLYVKGHRDEIEQLEQHFKWKRNEPVYEDDKAASDKQPESVTSK